MQVLCFKFACATRVQCYYIHLVHNYVAIQPVCNNHHCVLQWATGLSPHMHLYKNVDAANETPLNYVYQ